MQTVQLSKTSVEILAYLSSRLRERFTVSQIARGIGRGYGITYEMTMRLAEQGYVIAERHRPVTYCRLSLRGNSSLLAYIEGIRASRFVAGHRDVGVLVKSILDKINSPFFTMAVFGSYVKGTASKRSDVDILFVIPDKKMEKEISSAAGSVERISPIGIHEVTLANDEFRELLKEKKTNVAWEALDNRIVVYGAQPLFKTLEEVL